MLYVNYVRRNYRSSYIIFDGYETATAKASEHIKRQEGKKAQVVIIDEENEVPYSQAEFLMNAANTFNLLTGRHTITVILFSRPLLTPIM